ncbi:uncharacterized protein LOC133180355 [Saccostrea echinata]|uniref:uncharacterized protein LOC133180355 n=1 Tax=Saccostrea echinata TaxID=191078 RepID=UPI002A82A58D|nr:uncharacterized protein LOC133180355 [Saccostrea echinata]
MNSLPDRQLRRTRTLTQEALMLFEEKVDHYNNRLRSVRRDIDSVILEFEDAKPTDKNIVRAMRADLIQFMQQYNNVSKEYESYLKGTRTLASIREETSHRLVASTVRAKVDHVQKEMEKVLADSKPPFGSYRQHLADKQSSIASSRCSPRPQSKSQSGSDLTTFIQRQAAKADQQAAKLELQFAEEEAQLLKRQVALEAERKVLDSRKAVALAQSTFAAFDEILGENKDKETEYEDPMERTREYIQNLTNSPDDRDDVSSVLHFSEARDLKHSTPQKSQGVLSTLNPQAPSFSPLAFDHLAKYIAKRDLISARFTMYDDNPTHYIAWKATFQNIVTEVGATPLEHLDLLVRWLGPDSKKQVQSIRSANVQDPEKALQLAWERLDRRFGSPEIIEDTIQRRIKDFPNLLNHQRKEFFDLADLTSEIEGVKNNDKNSITFAYFDSSYGVNKLVAKLPFNLQEKWTHKASEYKLHHDGQYPPFTFLLSYKMSQR